MPAVPGPDAAAPPTPRLCVRLLGALESERGALRLQRLPSRAIVALLARLAPEPVRMHAREALVERLRPGVEPAVGRTRLRQALSTLQSLIRGERLPGHFDGWIEQARLRLAAWHDRAAAALALAPVRPSDAEAAVQASPAQPRQAAAGAQAAPVKGRAQRPLRRGCGGLRPVLSRRRGPGAWPGRSPGAGSYTHPPAHETSLHILIRLLL